jgi:hypothetical protein
MLSFLQSGLIIILTIAPEKIILRIYLIYLRAAARADLPRPRKDVSPFDRN